jgi:Sulfotransferase domain
MRRLGYGKVFGIGAARTGTSSLGRAFILLGFRHTSWDPELWDAYERGDLAPIFAVAERFETFEDGPWNAPDLYRVLDDRFPQSKFVLTYREPESWSRSHERHFSSQGSQRIPARYWIDDYAGRREQIRRDYEARNTEVREYFAGRPEDLLVLDVARGEGWDRLCPFLGIAPPREPFPHLNVGGSAAGPTRP